MIVLFLSVLVQLHCLEGRLEVSWMKEGRRETSIFDEAPVPFNDRTIITPTSGLLITTQNTPTPMPTNYVLLCNISFDFNNLLKSCGDDMLMNASAMIAFPFAFLNVPGKSFYLVTEPPELPPMFELKKKDYEQLMDYLVMSNWTLNVTIYPDGVNPWIEIFSSPTFLILQYTFCLFSLFAMFGAIICILKQPSEQCLLAHYVLTIEIIINFIKGVNYAVDPASSKGIIPYNIEAILLSIPLKLSLITSLLIGLFWFGTLNKQKLNNSAILEKRFKIPFFIVVGLIILLELISNSVRIRNGMNVNLNFLLMIDGIVFLLVQCVIFAFYVITGFKVIKFLKLQHTTKTKRNEKRKILKKIKILTFTLTILALLILLTIVFYLTPWYETVIGYCYVWFGGSYFFVFLSYAHIYVFLPRKQQSGPDNSGINEEISDLDSIHKPNDKSTSIELHDRSPQSTVKNTN